jgi:glycosyltransferase involved in cell wall biosynthesis
MESSLQNRPLRFSVVIPCYNEERTIQACIERLMAIGDKNLKLEVIFVDDCSTDKSLDIAEAMARKHPELVVMQHNRNLGKGAALKTGFEHASGDIVAVQDADLEYDPQDLKHLIQPILDDKADVVFGSRFATAGAYRVLYYWHSLGNKFLTQLSNMFSDLNLTDMECCYKVFRREVIQDIQIEERRFGVEPELVAKVAQQRVRIFEMGVSYAGRTYEEGKKIGFRDGLRAFYCIFHYNAPKTPLPLQFIIYSVIGGLSAVLNVLVFLALHLSGLTTFVSIPLAFLVAALFNYFLCIHFLFRHKARWNSLSEVIVYILVVCGVATIDFSTTLGLLTLDFYPWLAKSTACIVGLIFNFLGRKYFVFPEPSAGFWKVQVR